MILEKEKNWWKDIAVYQIYPKSFYDTNHDGIGDLCGIAKKLPYIKSLGVDAIWLCPFLKSPQADNGYDISDYNTVDAIFGTNDDLRKLIDLCHENGLKFIMDMVANHSSDEHEWFQKALAGDPHYQAYYYFRDPVDGHEPSNWASIFGGGAWEYVPSLNKYYLHLFHRKQPDLNWSNPEVVDQIIAIMKRWAEFGVDGFRLDAINYLYKEPSFPDVAPMPGSRFGFASEHYANKPQNQEHFARLNREVFAPYNMMTVAEVAYLDPEIAREYCGKNRPELDMVYIFDLLNFDQDGFDKFSPRPFLVEDLKKSVFFWQKEMEKTGHLALFLSNHDQPRSVSRFSDDKEEHRVLAAKMHANAMYLLKGTPYIYQGEELGMTNLHFTDIKDFRDLEVENTYREHVLEKGEPAGKWMALYNTRSRDNGRSPMQWEDAKNGGFSDVTPWMPANDNFASINAAAEITDPSSVFSFYQKLLAFRKAHKNTLSGSLLPIEEDSTRTFCYERRTDSESLISLNNFSSEPAEVTLPEGCYTVCLTNRNRSGKISGTITLSAYECVTAVRNS